MAGGTAMERLGEDGEASGDARDAELAASLLNQEVETTRRRRRLESAVRCILETFGRAVNADQFLGLVVIGREIIVSDRPVESLSVAAVRLEVVRPHAQRNAAPMVGSAAQSAGPEPPPIAARCAGVRLAAQVPAAVAGIKITVRLVGSGCAPVRSLVGPHHHFRVLGGIEPRPGLEHQALGAGLGEHIGGHASTGARADNHRIVCFRTLDDLRHRAPPSIPRERL